MTTPREHAGTVSRTRKRRKQARRLRVRLTVAQRQQDLSRTHTIAVRPFVRFLAGRRATLRLRQEPPSIVSAGALLGSIAESDSTRTVFAGGSVGRAAQDAGSTERRMLNSGGVTSFNSTSTHAAWRTTGERQAYPTATAMMATRAAIAALLSMAWIMVTAALPNHFRLPEPFPSSSLRSVRRFSRSSRVSFCERTRWVRSGARLPSNSSSAAA